MLRTVLDGRQGVAGVARQSVGVGVCRAHCQLGHVHCSRGDLGVGELQGGERAVAAQICSARNELPTRLWVSGMPHGSPAHWELKLSTGPRLMPTLPLPHAAGV